MRAATLILRPVHDAQGIFYTPHPKFDVSLSGSPLGDTKAMSQTSLSFRPTKLLNASSPPSLCMLLQFPSVPNPIHARAWSIGFLAGGEGTTTAGIFSMIE